MKRIAIAVAALCLSTGALAEFGVGVRVGTTGLGVDLGYEFNNSFSARVGYSGGNFSPSFNASGIEWDSKIEMSNLSFLADWNVAGGFRVTAGIVPNKNKISVTGVPTNGTFEINGATYNSSQVSDFGGSVETGNSVAPYLGIGYGIVAGRGVNFYFDLGLQYQGSPKVALSATCGPALPTARCTQLQNDVSAEQQQLADDVKKFKWYPVLNLGLTVGF